MGGPGRRAVAVLSVLALLLIAASPSGKGSKLKEATGDTFVTPGCQTEPGGGEVAPADAGVPFVLFKGETDEERGPGAGSDGNTYAPEIRLEGDCWRLWYGGQHVNGTERIFYAESRDGWNWDKKGIVHEHAEHPLIEDASVVLVDGTYFMYYTVAEVGITDYIYLATSPDGITWTRWGKVLGQGAQGAWDDGNVGRPSVLYEGGLFKMWYDGCKSHPVSDLLTDTLGEPCVSFRNVGYAWSHDGYHWVKYTANPILSPAEAVHVSTYRGMYVMLHESQQGTKIAIGTNEVTFQDRGIFIPISGESYDQGGHVTPFLHYDTNGVPTRVYQGLAREHCWCQNVVGATVLRGDEIDYYVDGGSGPFPWDAPPVAPAEHMARVDVSDTFTAGRNGRMADQSFPIGVTQGAAAILVENTTGTGPQHWADAKWSFADDETNAAVGWPGGSGRGSATGMLQTSLTEGTLPGQWNDWGVLYGVRRDFVVQADVVIPEGASVAFSTGDLKDTQLSYFGLTVRLRPPGGSGPEVSVYYPTVNELDTGLTSGLTGGAWHTVAIGFDLQSRQLDVIVDGVRRGTVAINDIAGGILTPLTFESTAVGMGVHLPIPDPRGPKPVAWIDNFAIGATA